MTDNANPETGATGIQGELTQDQAASLLGEVLDREDEDESSIERGEGAETLKEDDSEDESKEDESEDDSEESTDEAEEAEEETSYSSVTELAEALDMTPEDFLAQIKIPVKVDGKEQMVSLSEARDGFQMQSAFTKKSMELAEQRKAFEAERSAKVQEWDQAIKQSQALTQAMESTLVADYQKVNWDDLRLTDPAEYAAKRQEFAERVQSIEWMKQQAGQVSAQQQEVQTQEQQAQLQTHLAREADALQSAIPEWTSPDKAKAEKAQLRDYLLSSGYNEQEIAQLYDHRAVVALRKAMLYDQGRKETDVAKKKVATLPKLVKKGAKPNPKEDQRRKSSKKFDALKKSGKVDEAAALFYDLL